MSTIRREPTVRFGSVRFRNNSDLVRFLKAVSIGSSSAGSKKEGQHAQDSQKVKIRRSKDTKIVTPYPSCRYRSETPIGPSESSVRPNLTRVRSVTQFRFGCTYLPVPVPTDSYGNSGSARNPDNLEPVRFPGILNKLKAIPTHAQTAVRQMRS